MQQSDIIIKMNMEKMIEQLRHRMIELYFKVMDGIQNDGDATMIDGEEVSQFTYNCESCEKMTMYRDKPPADYPLPLCLSNECLKQLIDKQL